MMSTALSKPKSLPFDKSPTAHAAKKHTREQTASSDQLVPFYVVRVVQSTSVLGLCLSVYLAWVAISSGKVAGCGSGNVFDCSPILNSHWSTVFGIPVSIPATLLYATIIAISIIPEKSKQASQTKWSLITFLGFSAGMAAIWFIGLQFLWLRHLCPYCLAVHACGLAIAGTIAWKKPAGMPATRFLALGAALGVMILIVSQMSVAAPQTFELIDHPIQSQDSGIPSRESPADADPALEQIFEPPLLHGNSSDQSWLSPRIHMELLSLLNPALGLSCQTNRMPAEGSSRINTGQNTASTPVSRRTVKILNSVNLDVSQWPLLGKQDAKYIVVEMFDYTCPHCQNTDVAIRGAMQKLDSQLAVIVLPVPMNATCNEFVKTTHAQHLESCQLAKLAIAVWRLAPERFEEFHHWVFQTKPSYASALKYAGQIVTTDRLNSELQSKLPSEYVSKMVKLYQRSGAGTIPKILFPNTTAVGEMASASTLISLIERELKPAK